MDKVHVFLSTGRFRSFDEMREYIDPLYTQEGDAIPSAFIREIGLSGYEPMCIEAIPSESGSAAPLSELLVGASWSDQWLAHVDGSRLADAAICVFAPNRVDHPSGSSLEYVGAFDYKS